MGKLDNEIIKDEDCIKLPRQEKLDYCIANYPDDGNTIFMANFRCTRWLWRQIFKNNEVLSQLRFSEGVDLSHIDKIVLIDISFSTGKFSQTIARQCNHNRATPIVVDILVADKPGVGLAVYNCVAVKKENFIKSSYERSIK